MHLIGIGILGLRPLLIVCECMYVCSLVKFFAEVVKITPTVCDGLFSISPEVCSVKLGLKVSLYSLVI